MNDELLPAAERAGDLIDGNVDAQAAVRDAADAATDASVVALAEQFRALRTSLADVPPAPEHQREAALAAALAVFDDVSAGATSAGGASAGVTQTAVIPLARRYARRWYQVASIAAAVAAIGVIGTLAIDRMGGSDFDSAGTAETSAKDGFDAERTSADSAGGGAPAVAGDTTAAAAETVTAESTPVPTIGAIPGAADFLVPVNSPAELLSVVQQRAADGAVESSVITSDCPTDGATLIGSVRYQGIAALVWVESSTGNVQAVDAATCDVLETVTP